MERLPPGGFERIAVLDPQPGVEQPASDPGDGHHRHPGQGVDQDCKLVHRSPRLVRYLNWVAARLAQLVDFAREAAVLAGDEAFDVGEPAVEVAETRADVARRPRRRGPYAL